MHEPTYPGVAVERVSNGPAEGGRRGGLSPGEDLLAPDLATYDHARRYRLVPLDGPAEAIQRALRAFRDRRRVLWFVNSVGCCQALVRLLGRMIDTRVLCYHERFRRRDRLERREDLVRAFLQETGRALALTTPVAEADLELDADVIITELAPAPALVRRFVHANRHGGRGEGLRAELCAYPDAAAQPAPYPDEELATAQRFLGALGAGELSQRDLVTALRRHEPAARRGRRDPAEAGAPHDRSVPCVLDEDLVMAWALHTTGHPLHDLLVPVPPQAVRDERPDWLPSHVGVASGARYRPDLGFLTDPAG